jgi:hypothetical protein
MVFMAFNLTPLFSVHNGKCNPHTNLRRLDFLHLRGFTWRWRNTLHIYGIPGQSAKTLAGHGKWRITLSGKNLSRGDSNEAKVRHELPGCALGICGVWFSPISQHENKLMIANRRQRAHEKEEKTRRVPSRIELCLRLSPLAMIVLTAILVQAQTDCAAGNGVLDNTPPRNISPQELISKFGAAESNVKQARTLYTYTQNVVIETFNGTAVSGELHEITTVSYDAKGRRLENVTYAEPPTLRGIRLSQNDMDDIRVFMPFILTSEDMPQYNVAYSGQQRVDDLDTYVFLVEPKKEEKDKRYFQGRVWVDSRDLQIVKLCGKSVPEQNRVAKNQSQDLRPTFVTYRQPVDGYWFPAYTRVDDTLHFRAMSVHLREVIKFTGYKKATTAAAAGP